MTEKTASVVPAQVTQVTNKVRLLLLRIQLSTTDVFDYPRKCGFWLQSALTPMTCITVRICWTRDISQSDFTYVGAMPLLSHIYAMHVEYVRTYTLLLMLSEPVTVPF